MASGLETYSTAIENRLDSAWKRAVLIDAYSLEGGEIVALECAFRSGKPGFWPYTGEANMRFARAFAGGYVGGKVY